MLIAYASKCIHWVKLDAIDFAKQILEWDLEEGSRFGSKSFSIEFKTPVLRAKEKTPKGAAESYTIDMVTHVDGEPTKERPDYVGVFSYEENCYRMKLAEQRYGSKALKKFEESKAKK